MRLAPLVFVSLLAASTLGAQDADRSVKDGGIKVAGWKGRVDRGAQRQGKTVNDSKVTTENGALRLAVGPAGNFWRDADVAKGDYVVKGTFKELKANASHPHSYGVFIGGADLESDMETLLYCIVYGNGKYSVKAFHGAKVTTLVNMEASPAVKQADASGQATNEVGWRVQGGKASCLVNGTAVKTFDTADVVGADKLKALDGVYGIRVTHNVDLLVSGFGAGKP